MKIFAGYGRVSTREQAEKGTSLEDQDRRIKQDCENKGEHYFGFILMMDLVGRVLRIGRA